MKKLFFLFAFVSTFAQAQYKISGTLKPADKHTYVLLYKIEGARQLFVKNTTIKEGKFNFELDNTIKSGSYRVTYDTQNGGFLDFLYNKEDVVFTFNPSDAENTVQYQKSTENNKYKEFLTAISIVQYKTDSLQIDYLKNPNESTKTIYKASVENIKKIQKSFIESSKGMLVYDFIKATDRYNAPEIAKTSNAYLNGVLSHFFDNVDFENKVLYNSSFLTQRITDYVFYMNASDDKPTQETLHKNAVDKVLSLIINPIFKKDVIEFLTHQFTASKNVILVDYILKTHFEKLPKENQNTAFKTKILANLAAEIGRIAPDFSWKENEKIKTLSKLNNGKNYVLIFWSTSCPHCTREIPQLHQFLQDKPNIKVISFAMENDATIWNEFKVNLTGWHNALGLGKWENKTARTYQVYSTPSYFVLDTDKKIIAKPEELKDVINFISALKM